MFILFRPIKEGEYVTRHLLIALTGALIITLVIFTAALTVSAFLKTRNEEARQQKQIQTQELRENNAPRGIYERVPGGWQNVESGEVFKDGK
jgi:hypothetical protein